MKTRPFAAILSAAGMLILILDANTALSGAAEGLSLCLRSVIPSLFPFFVLSILLTGSVNGTGISILRPTCALLGIPAGAESLLVVGLLGGYPVGAQSVAQLHREGQLSSSCARRLLGFCSNAGPAFLFGIVAPQFSDTKAGWVLWGIHITSALLVGLALPGKVSESVRHVEAKSVSVPTALKQSVHIISQVCGWVILFRVVITYLDHWILWLLPESVQVILSGFLELTNGCCSLDQILSEEVRFVVASAMLSFGGLCVCMQTASVTESIGLGMYLPGKLLQTLISIALAVFLLRPGVIPTTFLVILAIACRELKKRSGNSSLVGV